MASSLQNQLLKAGLTDSKRAKKVHQQKLEEGKKAAEEVKEQVRLAQQAKAERDKELNRQKKEELERKAIGAQIRQLIDMNKIDRQKADVAYQFTDHNKIKKLYVTELLLSQLVKGQIAVVRFADAYELVPARVAEKIAQRDADSIVVLNVPGAHETAVAEDDPYADYKIPDDLMW